MVLNIRLLLEADLQYTITEAENFAAFGRSLIKFFFTRCDHRKYFDSLRALRCRSFYDPLAYLRKQRKIFSFTNLCLLNTTSRLITEAYSAEAFRNGLSPNELKLSLLHEYTLTLDCIA